MEQNDYFEEEAFIVVNSKKLVKAIDDRIFFTVEEALVRKKELNQALRPEYSKDVYKVFRIVVKIEEEIL